MIINESDKWKVIGMIIDEDDEKLNDRMKVKVINEEV